MKSFIKKADFFTVNPVDSLYFDEKKDDTTVLGGICSIILIIVLVIFAIIQAIPILNGEKTYYSQITKKLNETVEIKTIEDAFPIYFAIWKGWDLITLDYSKLDIYILHNDTKRYEVKLCKKSDL